MIATPEAKREIKIVYTNSGHIAHESRARHYFENRNLAVLSQIGNSFASDFR